MIRICGIDPSISSTGICIVDCVLNANYQKELTDALLDRKRIKLEDFRSCFNVVVETEIKQNDEVVKELPKVRKLLKKGMQPDLMELISKEQRLERARLVSTCKTILGYLDVWNPTFIAIEDYSYHSAGSLIQLAELIGTLKAYFYERFDTEKCIVIDTPHLIKTPIQTVKRVATTSGNAAKSDVAEGMKRFGFEGYDKLDDQLDAIAIALTIFYSLYYLINGLSFPEHKATKEKNQLKSWSKSFNSMIHRIGTKENVLKLTQL